jgi:hypothetical protein
MKRLVEMVTEKSTGAVLSGTPTFGAFSRSIEQFLDEDASGYTLPPEGYVFPGGSSFFPNPLISELPAPLIGFYRALKKAMAGNPFFSDKVPPKLNRWGDVVPQGLGEYWEIFSPIRKSYEQLGHITNEIDEELMYLGLGVDMPPKRISGVKLNQDQYNWILKNAAFIDNEGFLPDEVGYNFKESLFEQIKLTMDQDFYKEKRIIVSGKSKVIPTTKEDKLKLINSVIHRADNRAIYRLKEFDPVLEALISRRK